MYKRERESFRKTTLTNHSKFMRKVSNSKKSKLWDRSFKMRSFKHIWKNHSKFMREKRHPKGILKRTSKRDGKMKHVRHPKEMQRGTFKNV